MRTFGLFSLPEGRVLPFLLTGSAFKALRVLSEPETACRAEATVLPSKAATRT